jgi:flagellar hook-associated protein 2
MSTQPISSNQFATGNTLTSLGNGTPLQVTGLASGLDTNAIVKALMASQQQQVTNLTNQQTGIQALNSQLTSIQTALQTVASDAQALANPSLFANTQTITSTNSALVGATATGSAGAVVGGYQIAVTALASASQRTFAFTSPTSADTITIDGHSTSLAAGASAQDFVNAINSDSGATVWATVTSNPQGSPATVVLSERATGAPPSAGAFITVTGDSAGALTEQTQYAQAGQNAQYTINGVAGQSTSNTITGAPASGTPNTSSPGATQTIPGVSLSLNGLTPTGAPVSVSVGAPGPSTQTVQTAIQQFVTDYNSAISQIQTQLAQTPTSSDPTKGTLYGDSDLQQLLANMRQAMDTPQGGLTGITSMLDVGVSTGATTGSGAISQNALAGNLTLTASTLASAMAGNASGVKAMLTSWSISFSALVNNEAAAGGTISTRIQADNSQISSLTTQIQNMNAANTLKQNALVKQFAQMEAALSQSQSTSSWLTSQLASLPTP